MPDLPIKFFLDENITPRVTRAFKEAGYEIISIHSLKLFGLSNGVVIEKATDYRAIIVSLDKEFLASDKQSSFGMLIIYPSCQRSFHRTSSYEISRRFS